MQNLPSNHPRRRRLSPERFQTVAENADLQNKAPTSAHGIRWRQCHAKNDQETVEALSDPRDIRNQEQKTV